MTNIQTSQRRMDTLLARVRAGSLDAQLASGRLPEQTRLLAVRAAMLVTPQSRKTLAAWWGEVVRRANLPQSPLTPSVPVAGGRILVAEGAIRDLVDALHSPQPVAARGVAEAGLLLRDGTGPVYNARSSMDLATAVRVAFRHLETQQVGAAAVAPFDDVVGVESAPAGAGGVAAAFTVDGAEQVT